MKAFNTTHLYFEQISVDKEGAVIDSFWIIKDSHGVYTSADSNEEYTSAQSNGKYTSADTNGDYTTPDSYTGGYTSATKVTEDDNFIQYY